MGQVLNIIEEWCSGDPKKEELYSLTPGLVLRWINEGQLRFASKSEILRSTWSPTITSSGNIALPTDFLREFPDRVKYDSNMYLRKINHPDANILIWSSTTHYSIYGETFYVWAASACTPTIPYIKRPASVAIGNIGTADFDPLLPPEFDHTILSYLDYAYERATGDYGKSRAMLADFDETAEQDGFTYIKRHDPMPLIRPSLF